MGQAELDFSPGRIRNPDHETSIEGARAIEYRAGSQKARLLEAYRHYPLGLTDEAAAAREGLLHTCYWKRCGELRADGKIIPTGETRMGSAGVQRIVCRLA